MDGSFLSSDVGRAFVTVPAGQVRYDLVLPVAGATLRVLALMLLADASGPTATATLVSSDGTAISPAYPLAANGPFTLPYCPYGWMESTSRNDGLQVTTGAGAAVTVQVVYGIV